MINLLRCRFSTGSSSIKSSVVEKPDLSHEYDYYAIAIFAVTSSAKFVYIVCVASTSVKVIQNRTYR